MNDPLCPSLLSIQQQVDQLTPTFPEEMTRTQVATLMVATGLVTAAETVREFIRRDLSVEQMLAVAEDLLKRGFELESSLRLNCWEA